MIALAGRTPAWKRIGLAVLVGALATGALVATTTSRADAVFAPLCQDTGMGPLSGETDSVLPPCDPNDPSFLPEIVSEPEHGVAAVDDGYLTYTSDPEYIGPDSFTYRVFDGSAFSNTATVTIDVQDPTNHPPTCEELEAKVVYAGRPTPLDTDCDEPDGDDLTYQIENQPANGGSWVDEGGVIFYEGNAGYSGPDWVPFVVDDGRGASTSGELPVTVALPLKPSCEDAELTANVIEGETVPLQLACTNPQGDEQIYTEGTPGSSKGTLGDFDDSGRVMYTAVTSGTDSFTLEAENPVGATITPVTITIQPANHPPVCTGNASNAQQVDHGVATVLNLAARCSDADDDDLQFTRMSVPSHGTVPAATADTLSYTSQGSFTGSDSFTYVASDGQGGTSAVATYHVSVVNEGPSCTGNGGSPQGVAFETTTTLPLDNVCSDPDGDSLTYALGATPPLHGTAVVQAGDIRYTPSPGYTGEDSISYVASDGFGGSTTGTFTVSVQTDAQPPVVSLTVPGRQTPAGVAKAGLKVTTRVNEPASSTVKLSVSKAVARKLKIDPKAKRAVVIGTLTKALQPGSTAVKVRLTRRAKTAIKKVKSVSVLVVFQAVDDAGNAAQVQRSVTLRR